MNKTTDMVLVEMRDPKRRDIKAILRETYAEEGTLKRVGERIGVHESTLSRWLPRLGLELEEKRTVRRERSARPIAMADDAPAPAPQEAVSI